MRRGVSPRTLPRRWITILAAEDPEAARTALALEADRAKGKMVEIARSVGMHRRPLQTLVWRLDAWPVIEDARDRHRRRGSLVRAMMRAAP